MTYHYDGNPQDVEGVTRARRTSVYINVRVAAKVLPRVSWPMTGLDGNSFGLMEAMRPENHASTISMPWEKETMSWKLRRIWEDGLSEAA